jgi:hypothetical protein
VEGREIVLSLSGCHTVVLSPPLDTLIGGGSEHSVSVKRDVCRGRSCSHMAVCGMDGMQGQLLAKRCGWMGVGP